MPVTNEEMSLDDLIDADDKPLRGRRCSVGVWYEQQTEATRASFDRHVAAGTSVSRLWRACAQKSLQTGRCQFERHVKAECNCSQVARHG